MTLHRHVLALALALVALAGCGSSASHSDAGASDSFVARDAFGGPNFGNRCTTSTDCGDGYCVVAPHGNVCTSTCDAGGCPDGWNCRIREVGGSLLSVCVPQQFDYCTACTADVQCSGGVCVDIGGSKACLAECPFFGTCPTGYTCGSDPSGVNTGRYCLPQTGTCSCTVAQQGQVRTCTKTNAIGTCRGLETCDADAGGWVGCSATTPSTETCDSIDNDCDQLIDEDVGGSACMNTIAGVGSCPGITKCNGVAGSTCEGPMPMVETCNYVDDDCDGTVDEGFPGLSNVCSTGVGACARYGVVQCNAGGTATQCSAVAGAPVAEKCNGIDDDCDGAIDQTFPALGTPCSAGVGACARQGNVICNAAQTGTTCAVTPGAPVTEICNGLDDDCNGVVDDAWRNAGTGLYDKNFACGSCAISCTALYNGPNASGVCTVTAGVPSCHMVCNANAFDVDGQVGDGCELLVDTGAVYVSIDDVAGADDATCGLGPVGSGGTNHPCLTIGQGIARANTLNRPRVLVANGIYNEAVTIANGRSLLGGFLPDTWQRDLASTTTYISGAATIASTNHDYTVQAVNITNATVFEGFVVVGSVNSKVGGNSYAIYVATSNGNLAIQNNIVLAGSGGPGTNGAGASGGATGVDGIGRSSNPAGYDAIITTATPCTSGSNRSYTNGGARTCGGNNVSGGNGGGNQCAPAHDLTKFSALDGALGGAGSPALGGGAGTGGQGGFDMYLTLNGAQCTVSIASGWHDYGNDGTSGTKGQHGPGVAGCSAAGGNVVGGHWVGGPGAAGQAGGNGGGGGGGGAGGGAWCSSCPENADQLGAVGGGGGSGGCGGGGGGASTPGGGVFAIFVAGGTAPVITGNQLQRGLGGDGGRGGSAGAAGGGGIGAAGGVNGALFCPGTAGRGGNGGDGGHGSGGGGACGGSSVAIYTSGIGSPNYCTSGANNTITGGAAGPGGAGGYSVVNTGGSGAAGALATCTFN